MRSYPAYLTRGALLVAGFFFVFPFSVVAFDGPLPVIKSVGLQASVQVNGNPVKSPAIVGANTEFSIVWKSSGVGCVSNWNSATLPPTGSAQGSIATGRSFVLTCFGRGAAQSATISVNIGVADLIPSFSISGLKAVRKKKGSYMSGPFTLNAGIKNAGKLSVYQGFRVQYQESTNGTNWITIGEQAVSGLLGGKSLKAEELQLNPPANPATKYYRFCVDVESKVSEVKEDNNCSKALGPYTFVAVP